MQNTATLIDNIFVTEKLHRFFESAVLLTDISNHLLSLTLLKQTKLLNKTPLEFESRSLNDHKLKLIMNNVNNWFSCSVTASSNKCDVWGIMLFVRWYTSSLLGTYVHQKLL